MEQVPVAVSVQESVLAYLRRALLTQEFPAGSPLRPEVIAARIGVSHLPVREALKQLEGEGLVRYRPRRGYSVIEYSLDDLKEIHWLRHILEAEAVKIAVDQISDEQIDEMKNVADELRLVAADDVAARIAGNRRFHFVLLNASNKPHLLWHIRRLWDATDPYRSFYYTEVAAHVSSDQEHEQIVTAARERNAGRLVALLDAHRSHVIEALSTERLADDLRSSTRVESGGSTHDS